MGGTAALVGDWPEPKDLADLRERWARAGAAGPVPPHGGAVRLGDWPQHRVGALRAAGKLPRGRVPRLSTGSGIVDRALGGGLPVGMVTEIVGESGVGKSQLCFQLLLTAQWGEDREDSPGLRSKALYIQTETYNLHVRLNELAKGQAEKGLSAENALENIYIESLPAQGGPDELIGILQKAAVEAQQHWNDPMPLRLIVIDSLANLFKDGDENKTDALFRISRLLKELADQFHMVVVVTNHVVDVIGDNLVHNVKLGNVQRLLTDGRQVYPSLGFAWANCPNNRIFLSKTKWQIDHEGSNKTVRKLEVAFSPVTAPGSCHCLVTKVGFQGLPDSYVATQNS